MSAHLRAAVIGAGAIAKQHLAALAAIDTVTTVGVCDLSAAVAEAAAERFAVEHWSTDHHELLAASRPDVVHVTTPVTTHGRLAEDVLRAGCHVIVEKPITSRYDELQNLQRLAADHNRWLIEDHNYQYNAGVQEILKLRETGALGDIRHVDVRICLDLLIPGSRFCDPQHPHPSVLQRGGAVSDFLTHLGYLAYLFVGEHESVSSVWRPAEPSGPFAQLIHMQAVVAGRRGTAALGFCGQSQPDAFRLDVYGSKMTASTNLFDTGVIVSRPYAGLGPLSSIRDHLARARAERRSRAEPVAKAKRRAHRLRRSAPTRSCILCGPLPGHGSSDPALSDKRRQSARTRDPRAEP